MKIKKIIICIIFIFIFISCNDSEQIIETVTETEPPIVVTPLTADELYSLFMENKSVWEQEELLSGTLIDLDFDGIPELILMHHPYYPNLSIYKIDGDTLKEFKTIENIFADKGYMAEFRVILPYTDDNGKKSWVIPYQVFSEDYGYDSGYYDYFLSAFDFTGETINETIKFNCRVYTNSGYDKESYYGYPFLNTEFYIDGVEHKASQDKLDAFNLELERLVNEYEAAELRGERGFVPWDCGQLYLNPSQTEWEEQKVAFLNNLIEVEPPYNLYPGITADYIYYTTEGTWHNDEIIEKSLKKLTTAYCENNDSYLRTTNLYYDNGGAICKPVIYLYPTEPTEVSVYVDFPKSGNFTCTYPDYRDGWNVTAYPDGKIINNSDGLEYSYLYWSGKSRANWDFTSGFVVKGSDTAVFLRDKLAYLGLIPKEYNEFIVYWLPLMQKNPYNLITFQTTAYETNARLSVSPEPDSILRVFMAYIPLDTAIDVPEQTLESFERIGFSVIEWGGTCIE